MARAITIAKKPQGYKNYFVVDSCFLAYAAIPRPKGQQKRAFDSKDAKEWARANRSCDWWNEIRRQYRAGYARVYVPDICIGEAFKVLAKWYYTKGFFLSPPAYTQARERLRKLVSTSHKEMAKAQHNVPIHDLPTNRDIVIGVDRFFEVAFKGRQKCQIADLILLAGAKYLVDLYDLPREHLYVLSCDKPLLKIAAQPSDRFRAIDPTDPRHAMGKVVV